MLKKQRRLEDKAAAQIAKSIILQQAVQDFDDLFAEEDAESRESEAMRVADTESKGLKKILKAQPLRPLQPQAPQPQQPWRDLLGLFSEYSDDEALPSVVEPEVTPEALPKVNFFDVCMRVCFSGAA